MNWMAIILIAFIALWAYERNRNLRLRHENSRLIEMGASERSAPSNSADQDEIDAHELEELRDRVKVLERIATDNNGTEARTAQRIAREIESLRGDIARRSSTKLDASNKVEDLSE